MSEGKRFVDFGPIEHAEGGRDYIPIPGGWEYQTKGNGSSWRLLDKREGERFNVLPGNPECGGLPKALEKMARDCHAEHAALTARVTKLERVVEECCKSMEGLVMSLKMASALLGTETLKDAKGVEAETQAIVSRARALLEQKP